MTTSSHAETLLAQVEKSPAAVAVHDKTAWLAIFARYHIVEDPVGSSPHIGGLYDHKSGQRGDGALSRFFDTFIAPNNIRFEVKQDIVSGNHVVRDLSIHITMSDKVQVQVPMHLLYELAEENDEWRIVRLAAHWELMPMMGQLLGKGFACLPVMASLTVRMLKLQGIAGTLGFSKAVLNIGKAGKKQALAFASAFNNKSLSSLMATCSSDAAMIQWPYDDEACSPSQLLEKLPGNIQLGKVMAAGDTVSANITWQQEGSVKREGVAFFEFNRKTKKISALRCYFSKIQG